MACEYTADNETFRGAAGPKINYSDQDFGPETWSILPSGFLSGYDRLDWEKVVTRTGTLRFPLTSAGAYDPLAQVFFCLSRCEEYQPFQADRHGRFPAFASHAHRHGYLHYPLVDRVAAELADELQRRFPGLQLSNAAAAIEVTYDIDLPWAYRHRGWRGIASGLRDALCGRPRRAAARAATLLGRRDDPFDQFDRLHHLHRDNGVPARYFWLLSGRETRFDTNPPAGLSAQRELIRHVVERYPVGIHPSYATTDRPELIAGEIARLAEITGAPVTASRQHFLRFRLPATFRALAAAGIKDEYSMGYADAVGFRAGTAHDFPWYDLEREETTGLTIHPFAAMDVTLRNYLQLAPPAATLKLKELAEEVRRTGGTFRTLWHNSSMDEESGWGDYFAEYRRVMEDF